MVAGADSAAKPSMACSEDRTVVHQADPVNDNREMDGKMPAPFVFLDHTADAKFQAFGRTIEEAFAHAAHALLSLMWDRKKVRPLKRVPVRIEGRDEPQLLVGFLEEILFLWDARFFLVGGVEEIRIVPGSPEGVLTAFFAGEKCCQGQTIHGEVKAITYNDMIIEHRADGIVMIQVVVDI